MVVQAHRGRPEPCQDGCGGILGCMRCAGQHTSPPSTHLDKAKGVGAPARAHPGRQHVVGRAVHGAGHACSVKKRHAGRLGRAYACSLRPDGPGRRAAAPCMKPQLVAGAMQRRAALSGRALTGRITGVPQSLLVVWHGRVGKVQPPRPLARSAPLHLRGSHGRAARALSTRRRAPQDLLPQPASWPAASLLCGTHLGQHAALLVHAVARDAALVPLGVLRMRGGGRACSLGPDRGGRRGVEATGAALRRLPPATRGSSR